MTESMYWHREKPFVEFPKIEVPWRTHGSMTSDMRFISLVTMYRTMFMMPYDSPDALYSYIDGSCLCKSLAVQGPCALVLYKGGIA